MAMMAMDDFVSALRSEGIDENQAIRWALKRGWIKVSKNPVEIRIDHNDDGTAIFIISVDGHIVVRHYLDAPTAALVEEHLSSQIR